MELLKKKETSIPICTGFDRKHINIELVDGVVVKVLYKGKERNFGAYKNHLDKWVPVHLKSGLRPDKVTFDTIKECVAYGIDKFDSAKDRFNTDPFLKDCIKAIKAYKEREE